MTVVISTFSEEALLDALETVLAEWPALADAGTTVEVCEPVNESPERCPWVGLYPSNMSLVPRTLGMGSGFRYQRFTVALVMTTSSSESGRDCRARMSALVKGVCDALCTDGGLRGTVDVAEDMAVTYSSYAQDGNAFFQTAVAAVTFAAPVGATNV